MPYIKPGQRKLLDPHIEGVVNCIATIASGEYLALAGLLNYACTKIMLGVIKKIHGKSFGLCYAAIALTTGVLENVKQEFYRRVAADYELQKMLENGDVYDS